MFCIDASALKCKLRLLALALVTSLRDVTLFKGFIMNNLLFSLNATLPVFLLMVTGYFFRRIKIIDDRFASAMNSFVFKIALPVNVFEQLYHVDMGKVWDTGFVIFCFLATLLSIFISWILSHILSDTSVRGEFVQASYRSSASLLGMAYISNVYGHAETGSLMMIGAVPLYNIFAVVVLTLMKPGSTGLDRKVMKKTLIGIIKNPIIIGIIIGFLWAVIKIPMPHIIGKTITYISQLSTPMGLLAMGAMFDFQKIRGRLGASVFASALKLLVFVSIFVPLAAMLGMRDEKLLAVLIMTGSATTVTSFVMAKNMGHDGTLSSATVMITTLMSSFTLTFWIFILRTFGLI